MPGEGQACQLGQGALPEAQPPLPGLQPCCSLGSRSPSPTSPPSPPLCPQERGVGKESAVLAWSQAPLRKGARVIAWGWGPSGRVGAACLFQHLQRGELPTPGRPSFSQSVKTLTEGLLRPRTGQGRAIKGGWTSAPGISRCKEGDRNQWGPPCKLPFSNCWSQRPTEQNACPTKL